MGIFYDAGSGNLNLAVGPAGTNSAYFLPATLSTGVLDA